MRTKLLTFMIWLSSLAFARADVMHEATVWANDLGADSSLSHVSNLISQQGEPDIDVTPTIINFGNQCITTESAPRSVTVRNTGTATLAVSSITAVGPNTNEFILRDLPSLIVPKPVPPGTSFSFTVVFKPMTLGAKSASISITSTDKDEPVKQVGLSGMGVTGDIEVSPASLAFGNQCVRTQSGLRAVRVSNSSPSCTLRVTSITSANTADFVINGVPTLPRDVSPGGSFSFTVAFGPNTAGAKTGTITIASNDPDEATVVINLNGTGVVQDIDVSPTRLAFGSQAINTLSSPRTVTIFNTSTSCPLRVTSATVMGPSTSPSDFVLSGVPALPKTVDPGSSVSFMVAFKPTDVGSRSATIAIASDDPDEAITQIDLSGTGIGSAIEVNPTNGFAGRPFTASGRVAPGSGGVRIFWNDAQGLQPLVEGPVGADGSFNLPQLRVPLEARPGQVRVCALPMGSVGADLSCANFTVLEAPPSSITGVVRGRDQVGQEMPPVAQVVIRLMTISGAPVATTMTDAQGRYSFTGVTPGRYLLQAFKTGHYFSPQGVEVGPGESPLVEISEPPTCPPSSYPPAVVYSVGALVLPQGALKTDLPVLVTSPVLGSDGVLARFGSLRGKALPLTVRFYADVWVRPDVDPARLSVEFVFRQLVIPFPVVASAVASAPATLYPSAPFNAFPRWFADFNVSEFSGALQLEVKPRLDGVRLTECSCDTCPGGGGRILMHDLVDQWYKPWINDVQVEISGVRRVDTYHTGLAYKFTGLLPDPSFSFDAPIDFGFVTLDNKVVLGIPIEEIWYSNDTWTGKAEAAAQIELLDIDVLDKTKKYNAPEGTFLSHTYTLPTIEKELFDECWTVFEEGFGIPDVAGVFLTVDFCVAGDVTVDSDIKSNYKVNATITPGVEVSLPIEIDVDALVCGADVVVTPSAKVELPIYYDPDRDPVFGFDDPCIRIKAKYEYEVECFWVTVDEGSGSKELFEWGCAAASPFTTTGKTLTSGIAPPSPRPSVASDGAGHALVVWIQEESADPLKPDRRLYFSYNDGATWSPPRRISDDKAVVERPQVVFLRPNRALAVWVQNKLSLEEGLASDSARLLSNSELYYSLWDGRTWSRPAPLTNDQVVDAKPSLAAEPSSGRAMLAWLRGDQLATTDQQPSGIYYASFDGRQWGRPAFLTPRATAIDHQPTVQVDDRGQAAAVWVRDVNGNLETVQDRQIVMSRFDGRTWSAPETVPNLPAGATRPSLAFDKDNNPVLAFIVPPTDQRTGRLGSGDGNRSLLYSAYRRGGTWEVATVGRQTRAERPLVDVNADNQAIVMFRQFGERPDVHQTGDLAAAVADLNAPKLEWTTGFLTADGQTNWQVAFDTDRSTAKNFVVNVKKAPGAGQASGVEVREKLAQRAKRERVGEPVPQTELADGDAKVTSLVVPYAVDLAITPEDITLSNSHPLAGQSVMIAANVRNAGLKATSRSAAFTVKFYDGDLAGGRARLIGEQRVEGAIPFNTAVQVSIQYIIQQGGLHTITVVVDADNALTESDEMNNTAQATLGQTPAPQELTVMADVSTGRLTLGWDPPPSGGISAYLVYRSTSSGTGYELVGGTEATTFADTFIKPGVRYYYVVAAVDQYGVSSPPSNEASAQLPANQPQSQGKR
jgi:hypothetical protein